MARQADHPLEALSRALDQDSYEWLLQQRPELAEALETAIARGVTPREVKEFVLRQTQRIELALRLEQAARHLTGE